MAQQEKIFPDGLYFEKKDKAPSYVIGSLSVKVPDFIGFLQKHQNNAGYVNIDIMMSQKGKPYCVLNTWVPTDKKVEQEQDNQSQINNMDSSMDTIEYPEEELGGDIPF